MTPIRIAVAGAGLRSIFGIRAILGSPEYKLVALIDPVQAKIDLLAQEFGIQHVPSFRNLEQCLGGVEVDAVAVFTPDGTHAELAVPALDAGKFVFVEKPLDVSNERLDAIIAADERAGGRAFVGFNLRYAPVFSTIHRLLREGVAGEILTIQSDEFYDKGRTYFRRWNRMKRMGGGLWITKSCHDFDLLYWLAASQPKTMYARSGLRYYLPRADAAMHCRDCRLQPTCLDRYDIERPAGALRTRLESVNEQQTGNRADLCLFNAEKDTFDHGMATVSFANGILATYTVNVVAGFSNRRIRVAGTRATLDGDLNRSEVTIWHRDPSRVETISVVSNSDGHGGADASVFPAFADFIRGRECRYVAPSEAAWAVRMGLAAQESCDRGSVVHVRGEGVTASERVLASA